jgi:hypothetical protein
VAEFRAAVRVCFRAALQERSYSQVGLPERVWPRALRPGRAAFQDALPELVDFRVLLQKAAQLRDGRPELACSRVSPPEPIVFPDARVPPGEQPAHFVRQGGLQVAQCYLPLAYWEAFPELVRVARCGLRVVPLALAHPDGRWELEPGPQAEALVPVRRDEPPMPVPQVGPQPPEWSQDERLEQAEACWEALHDPLPLVVASPHLAGLVLVVQAAPPVQLGPVLHLLPADPV